MNMHVLNMSERTTPSHWWTCCQFSQLFYQEKLEGKENETEPDRKSGWLDMFERAGLQLWLCWSTDGHHQSTKLSKPPLLTLGLPEFLDFWPCLLPTNVLPSSAPLIIYSSILQMASMLSKFRDTTEEWTWKPSFTGKESYPCLSGLQQILECSSYLSLSGGLPPVLSKLCQPCW